MTKIFDIKQNRIVSYIAEHYNEDEVSISEASDSFHLVLPIKLSEYLIKHPVVLASYMKKNDISVRALITTSDQRIVEIYKPQSYAYQHVIMNTPVFSSYGDFCNKINILERSLYKNEKIELNGIMQNTDILTNITSNSKISFLDLVSLVRPFKTTTMGQRSIMFPGGRVHDCDKDIVHTVCREVYEEINLRLDLNSIPARVFYQNTFDKLTDKFYHTIIIPIATSSSSREIQEQFSPNCEVEKLLFYEINNERYNAFYKHVD